MPSRNAASAGPTPRRSSSRIPRGWAGPRVTDDEAAAFREELGGIGSRTARRARAVPGEHRVAEQGVRRQVPRARRLHRAGVRRARRRPAGAPRRGRRSDRAQRGARARGDHAPHRVRPRRGRPDRGRAHGGNVRRRRVHHRRGGAVAGSRRPRRAAGVPGHVSPVRCGLRARHGRGRRCAVRRAARGGHRRPGRPDPRERLPLPARRAARSPREHRRRLHRTGRLAGDRRATRAGRPRADPRDPRRSRPASGGHRVPALIAPA